MPITRRQFELGIDNETESWMKRVHEYLAAHPDEAFTVEELVGSLRGSNPGMTDSELSLLLRTAVDKLAELGAAEVRTVREIEYYAAGPQSLGPRGRGRPRITPGRRSL